MLDHTTPDLPARDRWASDHASAGTSRDVPARDTAPLNGALSRATISQGPAPGGARVPPASPPRPLRRTVARRRGFHAHAFAGSVSPIVLRRFLGCILHPDADPALCDSGIGAALVTALDWTDLDWANPNGEGAIDPGVSRDVDLAARPAEKAEAVDRAMGSDDAHRDAVGQIIARALRLSAAIGPNGADALASGDAAVWLVADSFDQAVSELADLAHRGDPAAACVHDTLWPKLERLRAMADEHKGAGVPGGAQGEDAAAVATRDTAAHRSATPLAHRSNQRRASTVSGAAVAPDAWKPDSRNNGPKSLRLQILSDLHLDVWDYDPVVAPNIDTIVVAGDVREDAVRAVRWLDEAYGAAGVPIVYVLGNHEPYGYVHGAMLDAARAAAAGTCVHLLENDETVLTIGGVPSVPGMRGDGGVRLRVLGATLWTDLAVDGPKARERALRFGGRMVNDYVYIRTRTDAEDDRTGGQAGGDARGGGTRGDNAPDDAAPGRDASASTSDNAPVRRLVPANTLRWHETSRAWLTGQLAERLQETHHGPTLVVTHHAPHPNSLDRAFDGDGTHAFFASDLSAMIEERGPDVWVHGHVHQHRDYRVGRTRIVCNPRGYPGEKSGFDPGLVIEIPADGSESEANEGGTPVDDGGSGPGEPPLAQGTKEHRS